MDHELAPLWKRLAAQLIDWVIAFAPFLLAILLDKNHESLDELVAHTIAFILYLGGWAWFLFYWLLADGMAGGQSYAKRLLGVRVVDATTGAPCTFEQSFVRNILFWILGPIDWIFILGKRSQRLGDMAANTIVVSGRAMPSTQTQAAVAMPDPA